MSLSRVPELLSAVLTPFASDGSVDQAQVRRYFLWLQAAGVTDVFICGTTGEFITLNPAEHTLVAKLALDVFGPEHVIVQVGAPSLHQASALLGAAKAEGAVRFAAVPPFFQRADANGLRRYFATLVAQGGDVLYYHFEDKTGVAMSPAQLAQVCADTGVCGAKISGLPSAEVIGYVNALAGLRVYSGNDVTFVDVFGAGGVGMISGLSSAVPKPFVVLRQALIDGDEAQIARLQSQTEQVAQACEGGNFALIKAAARANGAPAGTLRMPLAEPTADQQEVVNHMVRQLS